MNNQEPLARISLKSSKRVEDADFMSGGNVEVSFQTGDTQPHVKIINAASSDLVNVYHKDQNGDIQVIQVEEGLFAKSVYDYHSGHVEIGKVIVYAKFEGNFFSINARRKTGFDTYEDLPNYSYQLIMTSISRTADRTVTISKTVSQKSVTQAEIDLCAEKGFALENKTDGFEILHDSKFFDLRVVPESKEDLFSPCGGHGFDNGLKQVG